MVAVAANTNTAESALKAESHEIEPMLAEIHELVSPVVWQKIERVLRCVINLHGAGLAHVLAYARVAGGNLAAFDELLAGDELVSSVLLLHGAHPHSIETRVQQAVDRTRAQLGLAESDLVVVHIANDIVTLRAIPELSTSDLQRLIETVAPEVRGVEVRRF